MAFVVKNESTTGPWDAGESTKCSQPPAKGAGKDRWLQSKANLCHFPSSRGTCRVLTELVSKMRDMQMDKTELGCLRAIVLFNPGN